VTREDRGSLPGVTTHGMHCGPDIENYNLLHCVIHGVYDPVVSHADPVEVLCPT
jgi:hypothetical protein